jgi:hypothetical protein
VPRDDLRRLACAVAAAALALALAPPATLAARHSGGQAAPGNSSAAHEHQSPNPPPDPPQLTSPQSVSTSNLAKELDSKGQVDPVAGLGIRNPACDQLGQIRDRATRLGCEANGSPESSYPTSNYGFDVFIATGVTHPVGSFTAAFVSILNGIWLGLIFVLKLILALLGLAFGLNPFGDGATMSRLSASLGRVYDRITDPWLSALVVCGGIWFAYRGLLRRDLAGSVSGTLAAISMLVVGLWVVQQPRQSVGRLAALSDEVALTAISAPQSGSVNRPLGSYAEAMSHTWDRLVEVPFAGLDFSDVGWALSKPPPDAVKRADLFFCDDVGTLALIAAYAHLGSEQAQKECAAFARKRYGKPRRVIDLYLRSSPGSHAREALWDFFGGNDDYKAKVAAQGGDGALTRLSMLALFALGLLGSILLLAWLAIRLFTQAAIAFVLLLAAPFALFFPLLGDAGRRAFKTWGLTLFGAVLAKVIYAAFLSIVLLGISIIGRLDSPSGSATGFLLSAAFSWAVFLKRADLIGWLTIGEPDRAAHGTVALPALAAYGIGRKVSNTARGGARNLSSRTIAASRERRSLGATATRATAKDSLRGSALALADLRHNEARATVATYESSKPATPQRRAEKATSPANSGAASRRTQGPPSERQPGTPPSRERYEEAKALLERAADNKRETGQRWTRADLQRFAAEDRHLLQRSSDPADHAHRAGYERSRFEQLRGPERERAETEIERARRRDLKRLAVAADPPGRIVGRPRLAAERLRQSKAGEAPARRERLRSLRRERRTGEHLVPRRNLSRGA